ncbi:MAG: glycosyltransferase, partial [Gammaproteobacteria bacterium]|nr:glycosyltransferase [Gammaproteobacteria bacterium]
MASEKIELLSIIVPVYNEEANLRKLLDSMLTVLRALDQEFEIVFVNDGSTDGSATILDELAAGSPLIKVVHFRRNFG